MNRSAAKDSLAQEHLENSESSDDLAMMVKSSPKVAYSPG
jgi:hypothetical protein